MIAIHSSCQDETDRRPRQAVGTALPLRGNKADEEPPRNGRCRVTIEIYGGPSPNVIKVLVACEELGLVYTRTPLDILSGEQFTPEFLAISPNNRIPAIV